RNRARRNIGFRRAALGTSGGIGPDHLPGREAVGVLVLRPIIDESLRQPDAVRRVGKRRRRGRRGARDRQTDRNGGQRFPKHQLPAVVTSVASRCFSTIVSAELPGTILNEIVQADVVSTALV